jgi:hypothetical protein
MNAAPVLTTPKGAIPGLDPSQFDPEMMKKMSASLGKLPQGQLQKMQGIFQRAMAGKDVSNEAAELERMLPPDFMSMMQTPEMQSQMQKAMASMGASMPSEPALPTNMDEAKNIVRQALADGSISAEQAKEMLGSEDLVQTLTARSQDPAKPSLLKKWFGKK